MTTRDTERLIFVVGNSRSGTTLLGRMLGRGDEVLKFPELHLFGRCVPHGKELEPQSRDQAFRIFSWLADVAERKLHAERAPELFAERARQLTEKYYRDGKDAWDLYHDFVTDESRRQGKTIPCEDLPAHIFKLDQILKKFPQARIIHIVRDARDVLLSQKNRRNRRKMGASYLGFREVLRYRMNYHPVVISRLWHSAVNAGLRYRNHPAVLTIHFEELIESPEEVLKRTCIHCGIKFNPIMLDVPQVGSSSRPDNPDHRGIDKSRTGNWSSGELSDTEIALCERINGKLLTELGYSLSGKRSSLTGVLFTTISLPIKGILSLLLNLDRTKGLGEYLRKRFR